MKKKTLAWAIKDENGHLYTNTEWDKGDAIVRCSEDSTDKVVRIEIKEVKRNK